MSMRRWALSTLFMGSVLLQLTPCLPNPAKATGAAVIVALLSLIESWRAAKRPVEVHLYQNGEHGFGMSRHSGALSLSIDAFHAWTKGQGPLTRQREQC
jgi:hypothetical protein